jgi:hypothetical protein
MKNRDLIRDAMMFAVKDVTGRVLREATVQSMIDDFEKQLIIADVVVPKGTFYCRNKDATFDKVCNDQCKLCKHVEYMSQ